VKHILPKLYSPVHTCMSLLEPEENHTFWFWLEHCIS